LSKLNNLAVEADRLEKLPITLGFADGYRLHQYSSLFLYICRFW